MHPVSWWNSLFAAIDSKNAAAFLGYLTDDAEFRFGNGPAAVGHAAVGAAVSGFFSTIRASRHQLRKAWEDADSAVCEGDVTYTRLDGSTLTLPFVDVFYFRGEKIARYLIYMDVSPLFQSG